MPSRLLLVPVVNFIESAIDNVFRDKVKEPVLGSVLYCDLAAGFADHSGIYVGNNQIVHLDGSGEIELVSSKKFMNRLNGFNTAMSIYVSCIDTFPIGSPEFAKRANKMVGRKRDYNLLFDNCHQFTAGCLDGDFDENSCNLLWMLKKRSEDVFGANSWRVWDVELF